MEDLERENFVGYIMEMWWDVGCESVSFMECGWLREKMRGYDEGDKNWEMGMKCCMLKNVYFFWWYCCWKHFDKRNCEKWRKEMRKKSVVDIMWNQWKGDDFTRMICCWKEYVTINKKSNRQRNRQQ